MDRSALRYKEPRNFMPSLIRTKSDRVGPAGQRPRLRVCARVDGNFETHQLIMCRSGGFGRTCPGTKHRFDPRGTEWMQWVFSWICEDMSAEWRCWSASSSKRVHTQAVSVMKTSNPSTDRRTHAAFPPHPKLSLWFNLVKLFPRNFLWVEADFFSAWHVMRELIKTLTLLKPRATAACFY